MIFTCLKQYSIARKIEGLYHHAGLHAAGLVIGKTDLVEYVPLYREPETGKIVSQYTFEYFENYGLFEFDLLGLKTLDIIKKTEDLIQKKGNGYSNFTITDIPLDDAVAYNLFQKEILKGYFSLNQMV